MTVLTTTSDIQYAGLTGQDTFVYNFRVDLITDMLPTLDGAPVAQGTFTMTGLGTPSGGNVVLDTPLVADAVVILARSVNPTQEVDYQPFDAFPAETHEGALDKLTMLVQQSSATNLRALRFPLGDGANPELPPVSVRADSTLSFDNLGNIDVSSSVKYSQAEKDKLAGIEDNATADQNATEIKGLYESNADTNAFTDNDNTKLANIEAGADVTDTANVNAAGAVMHTDIAPTDGLVLKTASETYGVIKVNQTALTNPSGGDNFAAGYSVNSLWVNTSPGNEKSFICVGDGLWVEAGSTVGGSITSITGTLPVVIGGSPTVPDVQFQFRGAHVYLTLGIGSTENAWTPTPFGSAIAAEEYDTNNFHDLVNNNTRLTIPAGINKVIIRASIAFTSEANTGIRGLRLTKNGVAGGNGLNESTALPLTTATENLALNAQSAVINVAANDFFEMEYFQDSGVSLTLALGLTNFSIEVKE